jgi:hypothetical protein
MTEQPFTAPTPSRGDRVRGSDGAAIGRVDAVFADYVLVRTTGLLPVDLYVPRPELTIAGDGQLRVEATRDEAYARWHRPLRRAPHPT